MFGIPDLSQEFLTLKLGKSMIIVVSRKVGIAIFAILSITFLYFSWIYDFGGLPGEDLDIVSREINSPWTEFIEDWGSNVVLSNNVRATDLFKKKYKNNVVSWNGYFIDHRKSQSFGFGENSHAMNILIRMEPSETETDPDIVLSLSNSAYNSFKDIIDSLAPGDQIGFSGKIMALGDEFNMNHLHALTIQKTGGFKALPEIEIRESGLPTSIPSHADAPPVNN